MEPAFSWVTDAIHCHTDNQTIQTHFVLRSLYAVSRGKGEEDREPSTAKPPF